MDMEESARRERKRIILRVFRRKEDGTLQSETVESVKLDNSEQDKEPEKEKVDKKIKYPRMQNPKPKPLKEIGNISVGDTYEQPRPTSIRKPKIINYKCFTIKTDEFGKVLTPGVLEKRRRRRRARFLVFGDM